MTETRRPSLRKCGITRVSKVVLPAPLHPARPITFITFSGGFPNVIARSEATTQSTPPSPRYGLLRFARNDDAGRIVHTQKCFISAGGHCHANLRAMMKLDKAPAPLIVPNPADPRLTERVAGTDHTGAAVDIL